MASKELLLYARRLRAQAPQLPPEEAKALRTTRQEAAEAGATLHSDGRGGLPPSLVLGVLRRDGWRCKRCGEAADLSIHHKGGIFASTWLKKMGHATTPANLVTMCNRCHDAIHEQARAEGIDSSQHRGEE